MSLKRQVVKARPSKNEPLATTMCPCHRTLSRIQHLPLDTARHIRN